MTNLVAKKDATPLPPGKSIEEISTLPEEELAKIAATCGCTVEKLTALVLKALERKRADEERRFEMKLREKEALKNVDCDERMQKIKQAILATISIRNVLDVPRDPELGERSEREAYKVLGEMEYVRDAERRRELSAQAQALFEQALWHSPELLEVEKARGLGKDQFDEAFETAYRTFANRAYEARAQRLNIPVQLANAYWAVYNDLREYSRDPATFDEIFQMARAFAAGNQNDAHRETLARLVPTGRSQMLLREASHDSLTKYGTARLPEALLRDIARAYKSVAGYPSDGIGREPFGPALKFEVDSVDGYGLGPGGTKSRPRRSSVPEERY